MQQSNGIAALVQGNAAPMQPEQPPVPAGPPQGIPPDLKQLLAQQARNELQQAAQRYQALQQALQMGQGTGKPPTVAQQVEMQGQQAQPEVPEQDAGGLPQLPSNLPNEYAGGGIVAFGAGGEAEEDSKAMEDLKSIPGWLQEWWAEQEAKRAEMDADSARSQAARKALIDARQKESLGAQIADYFTAPKSEYADRFSAPQPPAAPAAMPEYRMEGRNVPPPPPAAAPAATPLSASPRPAVPAASASEAQLRTQMTGGMGADPQAILREIEKATADLEKVADPSSRGQLQVYIADLFRQLGNVQQGAPGPAPEGIAAIPGAPAVPQSQHPLADPLNKSLKTGLEADPRAQTRGDVEELQRLRGLPELLKQQQAIIEEQKARQAAASQNRVPAWAMGAMGATAGPRQNLGAFLASMGKGAVASDAAYAATDEANAAKIDMLRTKLIEAQMAGNEKDAAGYQALLERNIMGQGNAQQSAASVLNTDANNRTREQVATESVNQRRDAAEGRREEMRFKNEELKQRIKDSGDGKLLTQVSMIQRAAAAEATKRAITEVKERDPFASEISPLVAAKAAQYEAEALASNVVYQKALKEYMGEGYVAPKAAPVTGAPSIDLSKWGQPKIKP